MKAYVAAVACLAIAWSSPTAKPPAKQKAKVPADFNKQILETVDWLAKNKASLGYDLRARYTEDLRYGDYVIKSVGGTRTMCVAAVFEVVVRSLMNAKGRDGQLVSKGLLPGSMLDGSRSANILPYVFQYRANRDLPEYKRRFGAGIGDALVLFGMGRYVSFKTAKPGDFIYFNRSGAGGHAVVFTAFLDRFGNVTQKAKDATGFRYFSAQKGGTNGFGFRDAFFGKCPAIRTLYKQDCGVIESEDRAMFSVSRMHNPTAWFTSYSVLRVARFWKGDTIDEIYADESSFRKRGTKN